MTQFELTKYNVGRDLDELMNLDPRGYGVCRILYPASREYSHDTNVSMHFAEKLLETLSEGDLVYIITGIPPSSSRIARDRRHNRIDASCPHACEARNQAGAYRSGAVH